MKDQEIELLKKAMLLENEGAEYYLYQSTRWHEQSVCDNFKMLAEEEEIHGQWLNEYFELHKNLGDGKVMSYMKDLQTPQLLDWSDIKRISDLGIKDVFEKAMALEKASVDYYQSIKENTSDKDLHQLLDRLIQWEKNHYSSFENIYKTL